MPKELQANHSRGENSSNLPYPSIHQDNYSSSGSSSCNNNSSSNNCNSATTELNNDGNTDNLSKWSCNGCKRSHKRCDKKLPSCSRCKEKGWICSYDLKDKRVKPVHVMNELNNCGAQSQSLTINNEVVQCLHSLNFEMLEIYVNILVVGFPCLSMEDYENMLKKNNQELNERKDILALLLSIQCLCEQLFGCLEIAEKTAIKSRNTITHVFDQFNNPIVANTFLNLATFYSAIGNYETSRGYLNMVEHFINITKTNNPNEYEFMEINYCTIDIYSFKVFSTVIELNCCNSYPIPDIQCLTKLFTTANDLSKSHISVNLESNIENRIENTKLFAYTLASKRSHRERSIISLLVSKVAINLFNNGINIVKSIIDGEKLKNQQELLHENTKIMEYYAFQVIKLCETNLHILIPSYLTSFIVIAAKLNFEIFKSIVRGERQNNQTTLQLNENGQLEKSNETIEYYSVMVFGQHVLKQLSKIFPNVAKIYQDMNQYIQDHASLFTTGSFVAPTSETPIPIQNLLDLMVESSVGKSDIYSEMRKFVTNLKETPNN